MPTPFATEDRYDPRRHCVTWRDVVSSALMLLAVVVVLTACHGLADRSTATAPANSAAPAAVANGPSVHTPLFPI